MGHSIIPVAKTKRKKKKERKKQRKENKTNEHSKNWFAIAKEYMLTRQEEGGVNMFYDCLGLKDSFRALDVCTAWSVNWG